jgi:malate/lactate dehydrogenase
MNISIIGLGKVGSTLAYSLLLHQELTSSGKSISQVYLYDKDSKKLNGELHDLNQASLMLLERKMFMRGQRKDMKKCEVIVVCAGKARQMVKY